MAVKHSAAQRTELRQIKGADKIMAADLAAYITLESITKKVAEELNNYASRAYKVEPKQVRRDYIVNNAGDVVWQRSFVADAPIITRYVNRAEYSITGAFKRHTDKSVMYYFEIKAPNGDVLCARCADTAEMHKKIEMHIYKHQTHKS